MLLENMEIVQRDRIITLQFMGLEMHVSLLATERCNIVISLPSGHSAQFTSGKYPQKARHILQGTYSKEQQRAMMTVLMVHILSSLDNLLTRALDLTPSGGSFVISRLRQAVATSSVWEMSQVRSELEALNIRLEDFYDQNFVNTSASEAYADLRTLSLQR